MPPHEGALRTFRPRGACAGRFGGSANLYCCRLLDHLPALQPLPDWSVPRNMLAEAATAMLLVSNAILTERCPEKSARYSMRPRQSYIVQVKEGKFILDCPVETATPSEQVDPD